MTKVSKESTAEHTHEVDGHAINFVRFAGVQHAADAGGVTC